MRAVAVALVLVTSACAVSSREVTYDSATRSAVPTPDFADARVAAAVTEARSLVTGRYALIATVQHGGGRQTVRRTAVYDLGDVRASVDQTITSHLGESHTRVRAVRAGAHRFVTVSSWRGRANGRWGRLTGAEPAALVQATYALEEDVFPGLLTMLEKAQLSPRGPADEPDVVRLAVPAVAALPLIPLPVVRRHLVGADLSGVTAQVDVDVTVRRGVVTGLVFDATDALRSTLAAIGVPKATATRLRGLSVTASFSGYASRVDVALPQDLLSDAEFRAVQR